MEFSVSLRGLAALAVVCASSCFGVASASAAPLLWAVNSTGNSVSTFEGSTGRRVGSPTATGTGPDSIALTPDAQRAYVANRTGKSVTVIEAGTRIPIATIPLKGPAEQVAISPDGSLAYVTTGSGEEVAVIDTRSNAVRSIAVGPEASAVAALPGPQGLTDEFIYVGIGSDEIQGVIPSRGTLVNPPVKVGGRAEAIAFTPDGKAAYVAAGNEVDVVEAGAVTKKISLGSAASGLAVSPDGSRVYVTSAPANSITTIATATDEILGSPITVAGEPGEISLTADGRTAYVATSAGITRVDLVVGASRGSISTTGAGTSALVVAPDQPPIAAFDPPAAVAGTPATFSAAPSSDADGTIASYRWGFSDGGTPAGLTVSHTYLSPGTFFALLTVTDEEGCNGASVFTGRTAYCNGGSAASVMHPVQVSPARATCSARFAIGGVSHNRKNGTVRVRIRFPSAGWFLIFGKKIHAVTRKVRRPGTTVVTLHARVELNKRLKKTLRANVRYRLTFTPNAGCGSKTVHRSVALLRAPRHNRHS